MFKEIKNKSMRLAAVSMLIAVIGLISTMLILVLFHSFTGVAFVLNGISPLFSLAGFVVALIGSFSRGANWKTRVICVISFIVTLSNLFFWLWFNSITGIV